MSIGLMTEAWKTNLPAGRKLLLLSLCDNASDSGECYPSIATISQRCGMVERNVYRHLGVFEKCGAIERKNRVGRSTVYRIDASKFSAIPHSDTPGIASPTPDASVTPDIASPLTPASPTPDIASPPVPDASVTQNHHRTINESIPNTAPAKNRGAIAAAIFCIDDVDAEVWADFVKLRKAKKSPLTKTAVDGIRREAERAGWTMQAAIAECCARGWSGFKAAWVVDKASPSGTGAHSAEPAWRTEQRNRTQQAVPSIAEKPLPAQQAPVNFFDVEARNVTAIALG